MVGGNGCGSAGCVIGDAINAGEFIISTIHLWEDFSSQVGLTKKEAIFLFSGVSDGWRKRAVVSGKIRALETPQQTAARIRKFLYYKMRKEEIFEAYAEEWKTRKVEGNWGVIQEVMEKVEDASLCSVLS